MTNVTCFCGMDSPPVTHSIRPGAWRCVRRSRDRRPCLGSTSQSGSEVKGNWSGSEDPRQPSQLRGRMFTLYTRVEKHATSQAKRGLHALTECMPIHMCVCPMPRSSSGYSSESRCEQLQQQPGRKCVSGHRHVRRNTANRGSTLVLLGGRYLVPGSVHTSGCRMVVRVGAGYLGGVPQISHSGAVCASHTNRRQHSQCIVHLVSRVPECQNHFSKTICVAVMVG